MPLPSGVTIPEDVRVTIPIYAVHRDGRWFDEPYRFKPERFLQDDEVSRYAYFPFLYGSRQCIGNYFALMEAVLVMVTVIQHYKLDLVAGQNIGTKPELTLNPDGAVIMTVTPR